MVASLKWLLLLTLTGVHGQEPRRRSSSLEEPFVLEQNEDDVSCAVGGCVKRSPGQDEFGPFWANRGKKDPVYFKNKLYAEEPHWILVRPDENMNDNIPFYVTRGKKHVNESSPKSITQFWRTFFGANLPKHFLENLGDAPYFLESGRKGHGNVERSADVN